VAEHTAESLRELGLKIRIVRPEPTLLMKTLTDRAFDLVLSHPAASMEPDDWTAALYGSLAKGNVGGYLDRRLDEMITRSRRTADREARRKVYAEMQRYLADKLPSAPLFSPVHYTAVNTSIRGWAPHWSPGLPGLEEAWIYNPKPTPTVVPAR
jgi:peptide/nickel transport system substrate-binding protein